MATNTELSVRVRTAAVCARSCTVPRTIHANLIKSCVSWRNRAQRGSEYQVPAWTLRHGQVRIRLDCDPSGAAVPSKPMPGFCACPTLYQNGSDMPARPPGCTKITAKLCTTDDCDDARILPHGEWMRYRSVRAHDRMPPKQSGQVLAREIGISLMSPSANVSHRYPTRHQGRTITVSWTSTSGCTTTVSCCSGNSSMTASRIRLCLFCGTCTTRTRQSPSTCKSLGLGQCPRLWDYEEFMPRWVALLVVISGTTTCQELC